MNNRFVIYTVLVGGYDCIASPEVIDDEFDYICFVGKGEKKNLNSDIWKIVEIDTEIEDKGRLSRFPKLLPHRTCLSAYDYSLYIDANIIIKNHFIYDRFKELASNETPIALLKHPFRDCVYQEAYVCVASLKGGWFDIIRQIIFLKRKRFPKHGGLYEANVIYRKHNEEAVVKMDELWWNTFMKYSKRDQLSFVYALKETTRVIDFFLPQGQTTRNHPAFEKVQHNKQHPTKSTPFKHRIVSITYGLFKPLLKEEKKS